MLQSIRDKATGVFAWVIVVLLIVPFALWGIQEYMGGGSAINVASINDTEISRNALNAQVDRDLRGRKDRPEGAALVAFRRNVLDQMIQEELLFQAAMERGLRIHEAAIVQQIRANTAFQVDGQFDQQRYEELLDYNNLNPSAYQAGLGRDLIIQQFVGGILGSAFVTPTEIDQLLELQGRKLDIAYLQLPVDRYKEAVEVTDEQISQYYQDHKQNFVTPEKIKLEYLLLNTLDIEKELKFTDDQLQTFFQDNQDSFITLEQRQVAHILVETAADANETDAAKAEKRINEVYSKLQQGEDFAALASEYSDDAGSSSQGGDMGILEAGVLDKAFEEAAAKLNKGEYSQPVKTSFGYHIIKVLDLKPGSKKSFADAKADVLKMMARQQAETLFLDRKELLYNQTYENPDSLEVAATQMGMKIQTTDWFSRDGLVEDVVASDPKVLEAAFSNDVFAQGNPAQSLNSKLIELKGKNNDNAASVVVVRLGDYQASTPQPLAKVKSEIQNTLISKQAKINMDADIQAWLKLLKDGAEMEQLGKEKSLFYKPAGWLGRVDQGYDAAILSAAFKAPSPEEGKTSYTSAYTKKGEGVIIAIKGMQKGEVKKDDPMRNFMQQFMLRSQSTAELAAFVAELKSQADIKIFESRLSNDDS